MQPETLVSWGHKVRKRRGDITQEQLALICGVDQSTISRLEKGKLRSVSDELKWKVAGGLACTVEDLFPYPAVRPPFPQAVAS